MLHVWLLPVMFLLVLLLVGLYFGIRWSGGSGVRKEGRCISDAGGDENEPEDPKPQYQFLSKPK